MGGLPFGLQRLPLGTLWCGIAGFVVGCVLWALALIYGIFAVIPAGPFEERSLDVGVPFLVFAAPFFFLTIGVPTLIGMCLGCTADNTCIGCYCCDPDIVV